MPLTRQVARGAELGKGGLSAPDADGGYLDNQGRAFLIRQARPQDAAAVGRIMADLAESEEFILLSPEEIGADTLRRADELSRMEKLADRWHIALVEQDGEAVGMLDLRAVPLKKCNHVMELGLGLLPEATDRGMGTALMNYALERAETLGYRKVRLFVIACNQRAVHVYRKIGFEETGRFLEEVRVHDRLVDLIVMEMALP
ncbi:MAG: GNAT family N-acetyltransferase [Deltaproteobacteria bacterium]|nr:GNAT family N-acetyltransferase [Deltaproteobacteria bacterium]